MYIDHKHYFKLIYWCHFMVCQILTFRWCCGILKMHWSTLCIFQCCKCCSNHNDAAATSVGQPATWIVFESNPRSEIPISAWLWPFGSAGRHINRAPNQLCLPSVGPYLPHYSTWGLIIIQGQCVSRAKIMLGISRTFPALIDICSNTHKSRTGQHRNE